MSALFSSSQFSWKDACGTAEASDLQLDSWPDLIQIRSERTGKVLTMHRHDPRRDREGEIAYVPYVSKSGPAVLVFND